MKKYPSSKDLAIFDITMNNDDEFWYSSCLKAKLSIKNWIWSTAGASEMTVENKPSTIF